MELVAKGAQDIFLTGNPKVTFFKSVYSRHTNFSIESIEQSISGDLNFGKKLVSTIKRTGDLLSGITLEIDLPKIISKNDKNGNFIKWTKSIGHTIIDYIDIEIGGQRIDRQYGEWMDIWCELTTKDSHKDGLYTMIGKNDNEEGIQATKKFKLIVPLQFWFCKNIGLALPLVALQYHEVKLYFSLKKFDECWEKPVEKFSVSINKDNKKELIIQDDTNLIHYDWIKEDSSYKLIWEDGTEQTVDKIYIENKKIILKENYKSNTKLDKSNIYIEINSPAKIYNLDDIRLYCDYIYLDTNERKYFAQNSHVYLIEQIQFNGNNPYNSSQKNSKISLEFNHPCKELIWISQINLAKQFNQHLNFSDRVENLSLGDNPIEETLLYINGQERFSPRNANHFRLEIPYKRHTRIPDNFIYVYSFSLKPEQIQPSGTCNFSIIDNSDLFITYKDNILESKTRIYAVNYNILNIKNGMGGVAYSN